MDSPSVLATATPKSKKNNKKKSKASQKSGEFSPNGDMAANDSTPINGHQESGDEAISQLEALRIELASERKKISDLEFQLKQKTVGGTGELAALKKQLDDEREAREKEKATADARIAEVEQARDHIESQYKNLLGRVTTIRSTLGERMKADAEELAHTKQILEEIEEHNRGLNDTVEELRLEASKLSEERDTAVKELGSLRSRLNLAQQNWNRERDELINAEKRTREEYDAMRQAMQDWEVIAMEERSVRESLSDRVVELEEQLSVQKASYDEAVRERDRGVSIIDGLQRALQEIQDARKRELREIVENTQSQIDTLTTKCASLEQRAKEAESNLETTRADLERALPFEREVKEKNLLIGKLRHEAVTLNDHLRKALRMLKRDNADDKIDKQLVTNVFLQFVSIQRGDTKKYEVLQLIASVLDWNDEQREKAGLIRPGAAVATSSSSFMSSLKTPPLSPFHRSPSTPILSDAYEGSKDIWTTVLDSEK